MEKNHSQSLMSKYFTKEVKNKLSGLKTSNGFTVLDAVRSGMENPDSNVGVYAGDEESYSFFAPLFDPIIEEYHGYKKGELHKTDFDSSHIEINNLDSEGKYIISSRIRVGRNLKDFAFSPAISKSERIVAENKIVAALKQFKDDLQGRYCQLSNMSEEIRLQMVKDHFLFKKGDRFLESAGANRDWPEGRGIFYSNDKKFLVWVNEEDQLRIISMQAGGNIGEVFKRLTRALDILQKSLIFAYSGHFGYFSSCPTNLGTAMRASVHIKLPKLGRDETNLKTICASLNLSLRGVHGEHSNSENGVFDISNKQRLGVSETEAVNTLVRGVKELIINEKIMN